MFGASSWPENVRRWARNSPPCVVFAGAVVTIASGLLLLAFRLQMHPTANSKPMELEYFCLTNWRAKSVSAEPLEAVVYVPITLKIPLQEMTRMNVSGDALIVGVAHQELFRIQGSFGQNWTLEIPFKSADARQVDNLLVWSTCVGIRAKDKQHFLPLSSEMESCQNVSAADSRHIGAAEISRFKCTDEQRISIELKESIIQIMHDTLAARLHLLYTASFLFCATTVLLMYATCCRHKHLHGGGRALLLSTATSNGDKQ